MLKIKKQFPINKLHIYGSLVFFTGFLGTLSILTTIAPHVSDNDNAYIIEKPKAKTPRVTQAEATPKTEDSTQPETTTAGSEVATQQSAPVRQAPIQTYIPPVETPAQPPEVETPPALVEIVPDPVPTEDPGPIGEIIDVFGLGE